MNGDEVLDAARAAVDDLAVNLMLDGASASLLADAREWLAIDAEQRALVRHLLREADRLLVAAWKRHGSLPLSTLNRVNQEGSP